MNLETEYTAIVQECAEQGKALARQLANSGLFEPMYLYARPSEPGKPGRLMLVRDSAPNPYGYKLVTGEGLRTNIPYTKYFTWIYDRARSAPVLSI
jgi:hypothetical protein